LGDQENLLCVFLPRIASSLALQRDGFFSLPSEWQRHIVSEFEQLQNSTFPEERSHDKDQDQQSWRAQRLPKYASLLALLESTGPQLSIETRTRISDFLLTKLKMALKPTSSIESDDVHFIVNQGFRAYLRITATSASISVDASLTPLLEAAIPRFSRSIGFIKTLRDCKKRVDGKPKLGADSSPESSENSKEPVLDALVGNLSLDSHELRLESLELLELVLAPEETDSSEALKTMKAIEETPLNLANSRTLAMLLRKLGQLYSNLESNFWMAKAIPSFLFGMTTVKMSPVWDGAVEAVQEVGRSKHGEEAITSLAFDWLGVPSARWSGPQQVSHGNQRRFVSDFECTNVNRLEDLSLQTFAVVENPFDMMLESFNQQQTTVDPYNRHARSQSLRILTALPTIAEKRSRRFVPMFLEWAGPDDDAEMPSPDEDDSLGGRGWSLADRKAMLRVFGQFQNPGALFENQKVYQALLRLLENGDIDMQSLALKALLTWKQDGVKPYGESLESLLDDSKFKNEITNLLQGDDLVQPQHRPQLMPILLRLLYGRTISKKGPASGRQGFRSTRLAVLRNLSVEDMGAFLDIATGPLKGIRIVDKGELRTCDIDREVVSVRRQHGFLNMMSPLIAELGTNVTHYMETLVNSVLYSLFFACRRLQGITDGDQDAELDEQPSNLSLLKAIRTNGLKCLISLFRNAPDFNWEPYAPFIVQEVLNPRIPKLPVETAQGVSGILQLLSIWATLPRAAMFLSINPAVVPQVVDCLAVEKGNDEVKVFALGIIQSLVRLARAPAIESQFNGLIEDDLLKPVMNKIVQNIAHLLQKQSSSSILLEGCVETIIDLAPVVDKSESVVQGLMEILTHFLQEPSRRINPKMKGRILLVLESLVLLPVSTAMDTMSLLHQVYESLAKLFSYFKDRANRESLSRVLMVLSTKDGSLSEVAAFCQNLNSFVEGRLDEPDYDKRLEAFGCISRSQDRRFTPHQWLCLLHNCIFFIEYDEELPVLPSNSADAIQRYIEDAASCPDPQTQAIFKEQIETILLPAVFKGVRESSEAIRRQYLRVMSALVSKMPNWAPVADMQPLLGGGTDEDSKPSFFFDLLIASTSKQFDAIRMLQDVNEASQLSSQNISVLHSPARKLHLWPC
jgi:U3 small nucleolar RNA-associated protein 20